MQTHSTDRVAKARAVKRRLADMRMAEELKSRGWTCSAPIDEMQREIYLKQFTAEQGK